MKSFSLILRADNALIVIIAESLDFKASPISFARLASRSPAPGVSIISIPFLSHGELIPTNATPLGSLPSSDAT